ncbi:D-alanyl-D-alanine carboxypeptidase [Rhizobium sp. C4]|uniref:D-alanyl-D-alanine carboxypeptidase n=1 Tax=Rhizobium sp. C4 TaxID=1349800 RepID=UPI001E388736|nr:D-alanyl-D-alanine carboxypeptidase [Rhizobium sp. C4]MCD2175285.1 D-alanyl-D-alanine carboxypeptidase [Rhizobium sp. C4]
MLKNSQKKRTTVGAFAGLFRKIAVTIVAGTFFAASTAYAAKQAGIVIDANTGKVLYNQDSGGLRYPASLTKMMTLYLIFEALNSGKLTKSTPITMSAAAAGQAPTKLGVRAGGTFTVEQGILALVTRSANDVAWAFAETLGGSVPNFGKMMTGKARSLGMRNTIYVNPNGLPDDRQLTTARDQAILGVALRQHFPQYYSYFSVRSFRFGKQVIGNHNHLLGRVAGVDGIKTGYTRAAGSNLATSAQADGHSIVVVVLGERSAGARDSRVTELVKRYLPQSSTGRGNFVIARSAPAATNPITIPAPVQSAAAMASKPVEVASASADLPPAAIPAEQQTAEINRIDQAFGNAPRVAPKKPVVAETSNDDDEDASPVKTAFAAPQAESPAKAVIKTEKKAEKEVAKSRDDSDDEDGVDNVTTASTSRSKDKGWTIQVGAAPSKELAEGLLDKAKAKGGKVLRSADPYTVAAVSDGAKIYRARFSGFRGQDSAVNACKALKRRGISCWASLE